MSVSNLQFSFSVTGVVGSSAFSTRQNVKKRIENILYLEDPPADAVRLTYVGSKELSAVNNLHIADRSDSVYENSKDINDIEVIGSGTKVNVLSSNFVITQHFYESDSTLTPLYYKHILDKSILPDSVVVLDKNYAPADISKYKLVLHEEYSDEGYPTGVYSDYRLYNSFETGLDLLTGEYEVFFVQYSLNGTTHTEILNGEMAYKEASANDIWYLTGELKPWEDVYLFDQNALQVTLPAANRYAIRYLGNKRMQLLWPADGATEDPWFPRVVNSSFISGYSGSFYRYSIKEFENQVFQPIEPYKLAVRRKCIKLSSSLFDLPDKEIQLGDFYHSVDIVVQTKDEVVLYAITNDTSLDGEPYIDLEGNETYDSNGNKILWSNARFLGIDRIAGIVHLDAAILDTHDIFATYSYKETNYTMSGLPMNPLFGIDSSSFLYSAYAIPESSFNSNLGTQTTSLDWVKVSQNGLIVDTSQQAGKSNEDINFNTKLVQSGVTVEGYAIEGALGLHYSRRATTVSTAATTTGINISLPVASVIGFPRAGWIRAKDSAGDFRYMRYVNISGFNLVLSSVAAEVPVIVLPEDTEVELVNFVDEWTTLTSRNSFDEIAAHPEGKPSVFKRYFVLGELSVNPAHNTNECAIIDVREDGGGLREERYEEAKRIDPRAQWLNNFNSVEGQKTPGNAVLVIKLPRSILDTYSLETLKEMVLDSVPLGVYPVIRFFGPEPQIIEIVPEATSLEVKWTKLGEEFVYNVWYATNINGPWIRANNTRIIDGAGTVNSFVITGLDTNRIYYTKVTAQDKYYLWWYGYDGYDSIKGGLGLPSVEEPIPPFGNIINFEFYVDA